MCRMREKKNLFKRFFILKIFIFLFIVNLVYGEGKGNYCETNSSFKNIYKEEIDKKGEPFKKKLNFCLDRLKENKGYISKECGEILRIHTDIVWNAFDRYYKICSNKAEQINIKVEGKGFKINNYKYFFLKVFLNPEKYEILDIFVNSKKQILSPRCYAKDWIQIYFPIKDNEFDLTVYYTEKSAFQKSLKDLQKFKMQQITNLKLPKIKKISMEVRLKEIKELKVDVKKQNDKYLIKLPVSIKAYISYDFVGLKKYFPKDNECYKPEIYAKELPDTVYIILPVEENKHVKYEEVRVF